MVKIDQHSGGDILENFNPGARLAGNQNQFLYNFGG